MSTMLKLSKSQASLFHNNTGMRRTTLMQGFSKAEWKAEPLAIRPIYYGISSQIRFGREKLYLILRLGLTFSFLIKVIVMAAIVLGCWKASHDVLSVSSSLISFFFLNYLCVYIPLLYLITSIILWLFLLSFAFSPVFLCSLPIPLTITANGCSSLSLVLSQSAFFYGII